MKSFYRVSVSAFAIAAAVAAGVSTASAADTPRELRRVTPKGIIISPSSNFVPPGMDSELAHTNVEIFIPHGRSSRQTKPSGNYENPASLACVYGVTAAVTGCNPTTLKTVATTGSKLVVLVDAYDDPTATNDLTVYSEQYGLPAITSSNFEVAYGSGTKPAQDPSGGWELEESLDIEMAHALAPGAKVVLMEAASNSTKDLVAAERAAVKLVEAAGGGEISNSWAGGEFKSEADYDKQFSGKETVIFASAGDSPGVGWPSVLPVVVGVGGTTINRTNKGNFVSQTTWSSTGGGLSAYLPTPSFQSAVTSIVGTKRGVPDISAVANPQTGVWVYDTTPYQGTVYDWLVVGGTSVASPLSAAIFNSAGSFKASGKDELDLIYAGLGNAADWTDVTSGSCANAASGEASVGYDLCTGVGTPFGLKGK